MSKYIKHWINELEFELTHEMNNRSETNYNGLSIATCKRRLETAKDAQYLLDIGELTEDEAISMLLEGLNN